jgi:hypothetical protein
MLKTIIQPGTGRSFKLGRIQPPVRHSLVSMRKLKAAGVLPAVVVPETTNYVAKAMPSLNEMYLNDVESCCVISGGAHVRGVTSFNSGTGVLFNDDQINAQYSAIGGYVPGDESTDGGCDENTAISYWKSTGWPDGVKLLHAVAVDASNLAEMREAMYLFEGLFFGVGLPDAWVNPMPSASGFVWGLTGDPDPSNGHCFVTCDLTVGGFTISTWGMLGQLTNAAASFYGDTAQGGQVFAMLTEDVVSKISGKSPAGYNVAQLQAYLAAL